MSLKSKLRFVPLLMLVILLFSIGIVSATLTVKNTVSSYGITYRAVNDSVGINVTSSSNVSINGIPCTKQGTTTYICAVTDIATTATSGYQLTNTNGEFATASVYVDNNIGSISYTIITNQSDISLDYNIQDLGFNNNNACSGIATLNVYDGTTILNTIDVGGVTGTCTFIGSVNLSIKGSGTKSISVEAIDNVGNKKRSTPQNITLDVDDPQILTALIVKYAGKDEELAIIGGKASILVDLYFKIREDNLATITLDLSQVNTNPVLQYAYKNIDLSLGNCVANETANKKESIKVYECYIKNVPLQLAGSTLNVDAIVNDTYGNVGSAKLTKTFTVDNIEPKASVKTSACDSIGRCFVHNGLNNITLTMSKDNFNKNKFVFLNIPGSTFGVNKVQNCTGTECTAFVLLTCDSGAAIEVSIASFAGIESQDDAGNIVAPYATELYCDNNEPSVKDINITGENANSVIKEIVSGSTIKIRATISETESNEITATAQLDKAKNATEKGKCTKISNYDFECVWIVSNINIGYYEANILINVTDTIGNNAVGTKKLMVLGFKSDNETPDFVDIRPRKVYPEELNRIVVDMATYNGIPYYIYATYDLSAKEQSDTVSVLHQQTDIGKCNYVGSLGTTSASLIFSEAAIVDPYAGLDKTGKLELKFNNGLDPNSLDDEFTISCNISVIVKEGNYVYSKTQELALDVKLKAVNSKLCKMGEECTPGEVFGKKIEDVENSFWVKLKIMGQIDALIPKLQSMCKIRDYINTASFLNNAVGAIASMFDVGLGGGGGGLGARLTEGSIKIDLKLEYLDQCLFGNQVKNPSNIPNPDGKSGPDYVAGQLSTGPDGKVSGSAVVSGIGRDTQLKAEQCAGFIGTMCEKLTCSLTENINKEIPDMSTIEGVGKFMDRTPQPDVSNSIYQAFKAQCWPAVYYNLNKWRQTDCNYLYCLKIASYTGTDIATCDKTKYTQQCMIVVGEAYAMIPTKYTKYVDNAADFVKAGLPMVIASWSKRLMCKNYVSFETGTATPITTNKDGQSMCGTAVCRASQIMLCQIPLQVARFEDTQTRARQSERFVYPSLPDMCVIANCFGKENCQYNPDIFKTINQIFPPTNTGMNNKLNRDISNTQALANTKVSDLRTQRVDLINQKTLLETTNVGLTATSSVFPVLSLSNSMIIEANKKEIEAIDNKVKTTDEFIFKYKNCAGVCNIQTIDRDLMERNKEGSSVPSTMLTQKNVADYATMPVAQQLVFDRNELNSYTKLNDYYSNADYKSKGITAFTKEEQAEITQLEQALGRDTSATQTKTPEDRNKAADSLSADYKKRAADVKTKAKIDNTAIAAGQFGNVLFTGLQFANANGMLNFMNGNTWFNHWFGTNLGDALDTNKFKESLCNPSSAISINGRAGDATEGNVISCESGLCVPVLTYATERANMEYPNGTKYYIYSVVYYISPGDLRDKSEVGSYNIYFSGFGAKTMYGYKEDVKLESYRVKQVQKVFKSPKKYTTMCIKFDDKFPSYNQVFGLAKEEYCRDIKESGTWNTGSPYIPPEQNETATVDGLPEFDEDGRRVTATTNVNAKQPGVLE